VVKKSFSETTDQDKAEVGKPGERYVHYRSVQELSSTARMFYEKTGKSYQHQYNYFKSDSIIAEIVGMDLEPFVRAVFQLELKLENWVHEDKRRRLTEDI
jgi:hypothetical protein